MDVNTYRRHKAVQVEIGPPQVGLLRSVFQKQRFFIAVEPPPHK